MQVGPSPAEESLVSLPLSKAAADADPAWYDHYCFIGMGDHYFQFDYTPDQDCQAVLPLQVTRSLDVSMKFRGNFTIFGEGAYGHLLFVESSILESIRSCNKHTTLPFLNIAVTALSSILTLE